jgi:hypothetical protein
MIQDLKSHQSVDRYLLHPWLINTAYIYTRICIYIYIYIYIQ